MIKSRGVKWACMWHVWGRGACGFLVRKHEGKKHFKDLSVDGLLILKWVLEMYHGGYGLD